MRANDDYTRRLKAQCAGPVGHNDPPEFVELKAMVIKYDGGARGQQREVRLRYIAQAYPYDDDIKAAIAVLEAVKCDTWTLRCKWLLKAYQEAVESGWSTNKAETIAGSAAKLYAKMKAEAPTMRVLTAKVPVRRNTSARAFDFMEMGVAK